MPGTVGPNLGLTWGFAPHDDGWGVDGYNPGFARLDTLLHLRVTSIANAPPGSPANGDRYIVDNTPTGAFAGHAKEVAVYLTIGTPGWIFYTPKEGWRAWNSNTDTLWLFDDTGNWFEIVSSPVPPGGTDGQVLTKVAGLPAWADPTGGSGGGSVTFIEGGAWDAYAAYAAYTVVSFGGHYWINNVATAAPSGPLNVDINQANITIASGTSIGVAFSAGTVLNVGDILYFVTNKLAAGDISSMSIDHGTVVWTGPRYNNSGLEIWWGRVTGAYTGAFTVTANYSANIGSQASCTIIKDVADPADPFDGLAPISVAGNTATINTVNTYDGVLLIGLNSSTSVPADAAGWTFLSSNNWFNLSSQTINKRYFTTPQSGLTATMTGATRMVWDAVRGLEGNTAPSAGSIDVWVLLGDVNALTDAVLDAKFGSTTGTIIVRGAGGWIDIDPTGAIADDVLTYDGSGGVSWAVPTAAGGGGSGLFSNILSAIPTSTGTGLTTWVNQGGASVADGSQGIILTIPASSSLSLRSRSKAVPGATPYSFTALIGIDSSHADYSGVYIGWTDGTKLQAMILRHATGANQLEVDTFSNSTTYVATMASATNIESNPLWVKIRDDGTNVSFACSFTGDTFKTLYSVAKAGGYLGSSGYSNVCFGGHDQTNLGFGCSLLSWTQGT